jgi:hypothetical protein
MEAVSVVLEGDEGTGGQAVLQRDVPSLGKQAKEAEHKVLHELLDEGYLVCRTGWPDFICGRQLNGVEDIFVVEVKTGTACLTAEQKIVARLLRKAGLRYIIYHPDRDKDEQLDILLPHPEGPVVEEVCPECGCPQ